MSQNPEVKLARNTQLGQLAFTEAHLTDLNRKIVQWQYAEQLSVLSWGAAAPLPPLVKPLSPSWVWGGAPAEIKFGAFSP